METMLGGRVSWMVLDAPPSLVTEIVPGGLVGEKDPRRAGARAAR